MLTVPHVLSATALPLEEEEHEEKMHDWREREDVEETQPPFVALQEVKELLDRERKDVE